MVPLTGRRVDELPLGVLVIVFSQRLCPTRLSSECPQLLAVLLRLFSGPRAPLTGDLVSARVAENLASAQKKLAEQRLRCYRTLFPLRLLERIVFQEQDGNALSWPTLAKVVAAWKAEDHLGWMLGEHGISPRVWDCRSDEQSFSLQHPRDVHDAWPTETSSSSSYCLGSGRRDYDYPSSSANERDDSDREEDRASELQSSWLEVSERISSTAESQLTDMCTLWNKSFADPEDTLLAGSGAELIEALTIATSDMQRYRERAAAARARSLLCRRACVAARADAVRFALRSVDGPGRALRAADAARAQEMLGRARATVAKIRLVRARATRDAYCPDGAVSSLRNALAIVHQRRRLLEAEIRSKEARLKEYEALGTGFRAMAVEYARLRKVLEQKLWTLNELRAGD
jgi:hypothetical protein